MARVVVTGGLGFVGSHLAERLLHHGDDVTVYDLADPPPDLAGVNAVRRVHGDIRDQSTLAKAIDAGTELIYHLAAVVGVDRYLRRPLDVIDVNVAGAHNVLRRAVEVGARVVVASTSEVYGRNPHPPWSETSDRVLGPTATDRWSYATSKAAAEHLTFAFARQEGLPVAIVRYFNLYGPRQRPAYLLSRTIHRLLHGLPPLLYDGGEQTRCFTYVADAVDATIRAGCVPAAVGECFNIGSDRETRVADAIGLAGRLLGVNVAPVVVDTARAFGPHYQDIPRRVPDTAKAARVLGWRCRTPLERGLATTIAWARRSGWVHQPPEHEPELDRC